jgi:hypothetical protein
MRQYFEVTDFRLLWCLIIVVNSVLGFLRRSDVSDVGDVSQVHAASVYTHPEEGGSIIHTRMVYQPKNRIDIRIHNL